MLISNGEIAESVAHRGKPTTYNAKGRNKQCDVGVKTARTALLCGRKVLMDRVSGLFEGKVFWDLKNSYN